MGQFGVQMGWAAFHQELIMDDLFEDGSKLRNSLRGNESGIIDWGASLGASTLLTADRLL